MGIYESTPIQHPSFDRLSPDPSTLDSQAAAHAQQQLVEMTPPEESGDVKLAMAAARGTAVAPLQPSTPSSTNPTAATVFLSPETPTTQPQPVSKKTLRYPMVSQGGAKMEN